MRTKSVPQSVTWDPGAYATNSASQQAWARELIATLDLRGNEHILDVGCGDGKVTAEIARAVPKGAVIGIDASPQMIGFARKAFPRSEISNLTFQIADARQLHCVVGRVTPYAPAAAKDKRGARGVTRPTSARFDLIFSNAALHWVDDHERFLSGAAACLRPGGRLVVSCGGKGNAQDVFVALRAEMRLKRWRQYFRRLQAPYFFYRPEDYEKWLPRFGFETRSVRLSDKDMVFDGHDGLAAWLRTTWLPYTQRVPEAAREEFITAVVARYVARHPVDSAGRVHVRMVRLEIDATRI